MSENQTSLRVARLSADDIIALISRHLTINQDSGIYSNILRFAELNNENFLDRCVKIWGQENGELIFTLIVRFLLKRVKPGLNYWESVNVLLKITQSKNFLTKKQIFDRATLSELANIIAQPGQR